MANLDQVFPGLRKEMYQTQKKYQSLTTCPQCNEKAVSLCDCEFHDAQCPQGHFWHVNKSGVLVMGPAPHSRLLGGKKYMIKNHINPANYTSNK